MQLITVLPKGIAHAIDTNAKDRREAERLTRLTKYILGKYIADGIDFDSPIEISKTHFSNQVGSHYLRDLQILRSADVNVVKSDDRYVAPLTDRKTGEQLAKGQCKRYQLNRDLVFSDPELVTYNETAKKLFDSSPIVRETVNLLARLTVTIDARNLKRVVTELVTRQYILDRCKINDQIPGGNYQIKGTKQIRSLAYILELAKRTHKSAILYRDRVYLADAGQWISDKVDQTRLIYLDSLVKLKNIRQRPNIYCKRNDTNQRLDTNLTNLKSEFIKYLRLDGERLVSIDLCNSQFTILARLIEVGQLYAQSLDNKYFGKEKVKDNFNISETFAAAKGPSDRSLVFYGGKQGEPPLASYQHLMETISIINVNHFSQKTGEKTDIIDYKPTDLELFKKSTRQGTFYEDFQQILKDQGQDYTRAEIKRMMFLLLFSARGYNPPEKRLLAKHFPNLVLFANEFKRLMSGFYEGDGLEPNQAKDKGNAALAVTLQRIESRIFVDNILARLLSSGYRVFSKHDSILCKESDQAAVTAIVRAELDRELGIGAYTLKTELA